MSFGIDTKCEYQRMQKEIVGWKLIRNHLFLCYYTLVSPI